jgi:hypothetical protein
MAAAKAARTQSVAGPDVYTGMLIVSLLATLIALLFVFLDYSEYPSKQAPKVQAAPPAAVKPG